MAATATGRDLTLLRHFEQLEPFGFPQQDYHAAYINSTAANFSGNVDHKKPLSISDFLYREPLTPEQQAAKDEAELIRFLGG